MKSMSTSVKATAGQKIYPFDTSTPMGRAMLNICIVFAQLERETIQKRVQDAYYSRNKRGFSMGGKIQYGYTLEPTVMDGIKTKMLIQNPEQAEIMKLLYEMYAQPQTSVGDLIRYLNENNITIYNNEATFSTLTKMLRSPVYVKSDLAIHFSKAKVQRFSMTLPILQAQIAVICIRVKAQL